MSFDPYDGATRGIAASRKDGVLSIVLGGETEGNRLSLEAIAALSQTIRGATEDRLVVLSSVGPDFCLGREHRGAQRYQSVAEVRLSLTKPITDLYDAITACRAPIICRVQGRAHGLGCALVASCDITIAADDATFALPELKAGIPPTLAISTLMRCVPPKQLAWLVYGMEEIGAEEAQRLGIASVVVPSAMLAAKTDETVSRLSSILPDGLYAVKEYMRTAPAMDRAGAREYATILLSSVVYSASTGPQ